VLVCLAGVWSVMRGGASKCRRGPGGPVKSAAMLCAGRWCALAGELLGAGSMGCESSGMSVRGLLSLDICSLCAF
jgi:hypothetical protein